MIEIAEVVSFQIPQTEEDLQSSDGLSNYAAVKQGAIDRAKAELYGSGIPAESQIPQIVKFYLGDVATLMVVDSAIDWYQSRTVLSQTEGDETLRFYDRIASLTEKARDLRQRISQALDRVRALAFGSSDVGDVASLPLAQAQAESRTKVTLDPWKWARYLYGDLVEIAEGFGPRVVEADRP